MRYHYSNFSANISSPIEQEVSIHQLFRAPFIAPARVLLFLTSIALGFALGVRQYWVGFFTKTWGFMLHRSADRGTILTAKLTAAAISFLPLIAIWYLFYIYGHNKELFPVPPSTRTFIIGLLFVGLGYIVYLATALAGLATEKWYTTKMISLAFATWMLFTLMTRWRLTWGWTTIIIASVILLTQITDVFLTREFE